MSLPEKIPGMKPGSTVRNLILGGLYLFLLVGLLGAGGDDGDSDEGQAEADVSDEEEEQSAETETSDDESSSDEDEESNSDESEESDASDSSSSEEDSSDSSDDTDSDADQNDDVTIVDHELQESALGWEVVVIVENTSGEMQDYIEVGVRFYDDDGVRIDEWFNNATDVEPGERVEMTITTTEDEEPADYELEASTSPF